MKINKFEIPATIGIIIRNHKCNSKQALKIIEEMNSEFDEISKKVRKRRAEERKRKSKEFSKEFRKFKKGNR